VSLIFWHLFIALSTVAVMLSLVVFLWSVIPPIERKVEKQPYPAKKQYPEPVKVLLSELKFEEAKQVEVLPIPQESPKPETIRPEPKVYEDTRGIAEYEASINTLKKLIPPEKYPWTGKSHWDYPQGPKMWEFYQKEIYRRRVVDEAGLEDKLNLSYKRSNISKYPEKKQLLDAYIGVVKLVSEEKRLDALYSLIDHVSTNFNQNINVFQAIASVAIKMKEEKNIGYINTLGEFSNNYPNENVPFIDYVSNVIDKFNIQERSKIIENMITSYHYFFKQDIAKLKEATDLVVPMMSQIKGENHSKALIQYYRLFQQKNLDRDNSIAQIDYEYKEEVGKIDYQYDLEQVNWTQKHYEKISKKADYRYKSLLVIGGGILLFVLIASILVFLSIQRSVRRIEEKIIQQTTE